MNVKHGPHALRLFLKRGDDGEWARVTMVQGKLPIPSVIFAKAEIQIDNQPSITTVANASGSERKLWEERGLRFMGRLF